MLRWRAGSRAGVGEQLAEKAKLLSNKAECCLRAEAWEDAEGAASLALLLDAQHAKSLLRRALPAPGRASPHRTLPAPASPCRTRARLAQAALPRADLASPPLHLPHRPGALRRGLGARRPR